MMFKPLHVDVLALISGVAVGGQVARPTIPELLARSGGSTAGGEGMPSGIAPTIASLLPQVDIAVRGVVGPPTTYMTDDLRDVFTDYPIVEPVFLFRSAAASSPRPGLLPEATVTLRSGSVTVDGFVYSYVAEALPSLERGTECLFLLREFEGHLYPVGRYYGVFQIADGKLRPLTRKRGFATELNEIPARQAISEILNGLRSR